MFPHILYCVSVWGGCNKTQKHRVQKIINHAAQIVSGCSRRTHVTPLLAQLNWQSIDSLIRERDIITLHKLTHSPQAPVNVKQLLTQCSMVSSRQTHRELEILYLYKISMVKPGLRRRASCICLGCTLSERGGIFATEPQRVGTSRLMLFATCRSRLRSQ